MREVLQNCLKILGDNRPGWFIEDDIFEMAKACSLDEGETKALLDAYDKRLAGESL